MSPQVFHTLNLFREARAGESSLIPFKKCKGVVVLCSASLSILRSSSCNPGVVKMTERAFQRKIYHARSDAVRSAALSS